MKFDEWWKKESLIYDTKKKDFEAYLARLAWDAAREEAAKIVWDYARCATDKHISEIVEDIQAL